MVVDNEKPLAFAGGFLHGGFMSHQISGLRLPEYATALYGDSPTAVPNTAEAAAAVQGSLFFDLAGGLWEKKTSGTSISAWEKSDSPAYRLYSGLVAEGAGAEVDRRPVTAESVFSWALVVEDAGNPQNSRVFSLDVIPSSVLNKAPQFTVRTLFRDGNIPGFDMDVVVDQAPAVDELVLIAKATVPLLVKVVRSSGMVASSGSSGGTGGTGGSGDPYTLPQASETVLGGVKLGAGVALDAQGRLTFPESVQTINGRAPDSAGSLTLAYGDIPDAPTPYQLPQASSNALGGIKLGSGLTKDADGTVHAQVGGVIASPVRTRVSEGEVLFSFEGTVAPTTGTQVWRPTRDVTVEGISLSLVTAGSDDLEVQPKVNGQPVGAPMVLVSGARHVVVPLTIPVLQGVPLSFDVVGGLTGKDLNIQVTYTFTSDWPVATETIPGMVRVGAGLAVADGLVFNPSGRTVLGADYFAGGNKVLTIGVGGDFETLSDFVAFVNSTKITVPGVFVLGVFLNAGVVSGDLEVYPSDGYPAYYLQGAGDPFSAVPATTITEIVEVVLGTPESVRVRVSNPDVFYVGGVVGVPEGVLSGALTVTAVVGDVVTLTYDGQLDLGITIGAVSIPVVAPRNTVSGVFRIGGQFGSSQVHGGALNIGFERLEVVGCPATLYDQVVCKTLQGLSGAVVGGTGSAYFGSLAMVDGSRYVGGGSFRGGVNTVSALMQSSVALLYPDFGLPVSQGTDMLRKLRFNSRITLVSPQFTDGVASSVLTNTVPPSCVVEAVADTDLEQVF